MKTLTGVRSVVLVCALIGLTAATAAEPMFFGVSRGRRSVPGILRYSNSRGSDCASDRACRPTSRTARPRPVYGVRGFDGPSFRRPTDNRSSGTDFERGEPSRRDQAFRDPRSQAPVRQPERRNESFDRRIPEDPFTSPQVAERQQTSRPATIDWQQDVRRGLEEATATGRPVLVKFGARWCGACQRMRSETFVSPQMIDLVNSCFVPVDVDVDQNGELARSLRIESVPTVIVLSPQGKTLERIEGFRSVSQLVPILERHCRRPSARELSGAGTLRRAP